jgi:hypothetical protein
MGFAISVREKCLFSGLITPVSTVEIGKVARYEHR